MTSHYIRFLFLFVPTESVSLSQAIIQLRNTFVSYLNGFVENEMKYNVM